MKATFASFDAGNHDLLAWVSRWLLAHDPRGKTDAMQPPGTRSTPDDDETSHEQTLRCDRGGL